MIVVWRALLTALLALKMGFGWLLIQVKKKIKVMSRRTTTQHARAQPVIKGVVGQCVNTRGGGHA